MTLTQLRLWARPYVKLVRHFRRRTFSLLAMRAQFNLAERFGKQLRLTPRQMAECPHTFPMRVTVSTSRVIGVEQHFADIQIVCGRCRRPYAPLAQVIVNRRIPAPRNPDPTVLRLPLQPPSTKLLGDSQH